MKKTIVSILISIDLVYKTVINELKSNNYKKIHKRFDID